MSVAALISKITVPQAEPGIFNPVCLADLSDEQLARRLVGHASQIAALTAQFFDVLVEFDDRHAWSGEGIGSCAQWLAWRTGLSPRAAQDHLRIAHALTGLPLLHAAFALGRLSYSKVRVLTRVATADREEELLNVALCSTAGQLERLIRAMRRIDRADDEAEAGVIESTGQWRWNDDGTLSVHLRLSPLEGGRFLAGWFAASTNAPAPQMTPTYPPTP